LGTDILPVADPAERVLDVDGMETSGRERASLMVSSLSPAFLIVPGSLVWVMLRSLPESVSPDLTKARNRFSARRAASRVIRWGSAENVTTNGLLRCVFLEAGGPRKRLRDY
jgi:hypothetical protein